jgi:hypothetical protein
MSNLVNLQNKHIYILCCIEENFKVSLKIFLQIGVMEIRKDQNNQLINGTYHMNMN